MPCGPFFLKNVKFPTNRTPDISKLNTIRPTLSANETNTLTIITPCSRQQNIPILYNSIPFDKIDKWIIVYDTSRDRTYTRLYDSHLHILEVECDVVGSAGHPQRNYGMSLVDNGFIYFLDDDNILHPEFGSIIDQLNSKYFYTFNQQRTATTILYGNNIQPDHIDTAMFIVHKQHVKHITWITDLYHADGVFISDIARQNNGAHIYLNKVGCYYNFISPT